MDIVLLLGLNTLTSIILEGRLGHGVRAIRQGLASVCPISQGGDLVGLRSSYHRPSLETFAIPSNLIGLFEIMNFS